MAIETNILIQETKTDTANRVSWISVDIIVSGGSGTISGGTVSLKDPTASSYTNIGTMSGVVVSADTATTVFSWSGTVPWKDIGDSTLTVKHTSFTLGGSTVAQTTNTYTVVSFPLATTITWTGDLVAGQSTQFTLHKASNSYTTSIYAYIDRGVYTILDNSSDTTVTYLWLEALFINDYESKSIKGTIKVITYSNGEEIGTQEYAVDIYAPASPPILQNVTFTYGYETDVGQDYVTAEGLTGKYYNNGLTYVRIRFKAIPRVNGKVMLITANGDFGDFVLYDARGGDQGAGEYTFDGYINHIYGKTGTNTETISIIDYRGNRATAQTQVDLYMPSAPALTGVSLTRGTYSGGSFTENIDGTAIRVTGTLVSETTMGDLMFYKAGSLVDYNHYSSGTVTYYYTGVSATQNTELKIIVENKLSSSEYIYMATLSKPDFNFNPTLHGIGIGKQAEHNALEVNKDEYLYGDLLIDNGTKTTERNIRIYNDANSAHHHDVAIYGGNPNSATVLGVWDYARLATVMYYTDDQLFGIMNYGDSLNGDVQIMGHSVKNYLKRYANITTQDLNSLSDPGIYTQNDGSYATSGRHYPRTQAGILEVWSSTDAGRILQRYTAYDGLSMYMRTYNSGDGWSNWICVYGDSTNLSTEDLNTITIVGTYIQESSSAATAARNYPATVSGLLEVFSNNGRNYIFQRYTAYNGTAVYLRYRWNGTWYAWNTI